jgi:hypothetical protein
LSKVNKTEYVAQICKQNSEEDFTTLIQNLPSSEPPAKTKGKLEARQTDNIYEYIGQQDCCFRYIQSRSTQEEKDTLRKRIGMGAGGVRSNSQVVGNQRQPELSGVREEGRHAIWFATAGCVPVN